MSNDRDDERVYVFEPVDSRGEGSVGWGAGDWSTSSGTREASSAGNTRRRSDGEGAAEDSGDDAWQSIIDSVGGNGLPAPGVKRGPVTKLPPRKEAAAEPDTVDTIDASRAAAAVTEARRATAAITDATHATAAMADALGEVSTRVAALRAAAAKTTASDLGDADEEALDAQADVTGDMGDDTEDADDVPEVSRKVKSRPRHRRRDRPRSKTIALKRLTRDELRRGALANPPVEGVDRPQTRAECRDAPRPCPWVACKHHLYLDINPRTGSIKINFPDLEPWELQHTCALDVADSGGLTLEEIGLITNLTRERVRQVEVRGLLTLKARSGPLR